MWWLDAVEPLESAEEVRRVSMWSNHPELRQKYPTLHLILLVTPFEVQFKGSLLSNLSELMQKGSSFLFDSVMELFEEVQGVQYQVS